MEELKIKSLTIENYKCFEKVECSFENDDESVYQWNVFLGNNNSGKTNLLKIIAGLRASEITLPSREGKPEIKRLVPAFIHEKQIIQSIIDKVKNNLYCKVTNYDKEWGLIQNSLRPISLICRISSYTDMVFLDILLQKD